MVHVVFLVGLTAAGEIVLWFLASADLWIPKQSPLTGVYHRVLSVRDNQNVVVDGKPAGPGRMLGKEIRCHITQIHQPFMMLRCGNASSTAMVMSFMVCCITGQFLEKRLTHMSWKDPAEKNLEATVDLRLNISLLLLSSRVRQSP